MGWKALLLNEIMVLGLVLSRWGKENNDGHLIVKKNIVENYEATDRMADC